MKVVLAFLANTLCNVAIGLLVAKFLGPEEFGRFALALAIGAALQTLLFEWIRLSAVRFYSQRSRTERPDLRPTLDFAFLVFAAGVALAAAIALFAGASFPLPSALIGLAVAASIANGLFDFTTALARARFDDGLYGRLVLTKNFAALLLTAGGALIFHSAAMALTGVAASMAGSIALFWRSLAEDRPRGVRPSAAVARECAAYAAPIVVGNLLIYALLPLFNRALMARWHGYADADAQHRHDDERADRAEEDKDAVVAHGHERGQPDGLRTRERRAGALSAREGRARVRGRGGGRAPCLRARSRRPW